MKNGQLQGKAKWRQLCYATRLWQSLILSAVLWHRDVAAAKPKGTEDRRTKVQTDCA